MEGMGSLLRPDEQAHFMELESLFNSAGWSRLSKMLEEQLAGVPEQVFWNATKFEEVLVARVRMQEQLALLRMPLVLEGQKENLIRERLEAADEAHAAQTSNE